MGCRTRGCRSVCPVQVRPPLENEAWMSRILDKASAVAVAATLFATLFSADGSGAAAQGSARAAQQEPLAMVSQPVVQQLPAQQDEAAADQTGAETGFEDSDFESASSLTELVDAQPQRELSRELNCLAGAIYFEAKSESLEGQLAVGRVIVARTTSGRYPTSYCGVVYQRSQFSFVRGNSMPPINKNSRDWREAVALAQIADAGSWESPVEGAISFHATSVSPRWRLTRVARVGNHIFYR
jgi:N-acetylmuramoyl-L-alanine amidase